MKCVLFTVVNWIDKFEEIMEGSEKTVPVLKEVIKITLSLYKFLMKISTKEERLNFRKT